MSHRDEETRSATDLLDQKNASGQQYSSHKGLDRPKTAPPRMVFIPGGTFRMGSDMHYVEEAPAHLVTVDSFWMDETLVTNAEFQKFVEETSYVTLAEIAPKPPETQECADEPAPVLEAGSLVFRSPVGHVDMRDRSQWWEFRAGANWRSPYGDNSSIKGIEDHPVVHVAYEDAMAYTRWAGKTLPTEAEWEFAARGGLDGADYAWGNEFSPGGRQMANTWQGNFPQENTNLDGFERTSPVKAFPPNSYGICDLIGNVWEWTTDWYVPGHPAPSPNAHRTPKNPRGPREDESYDPCQPHIRTPRKVLKGGSHLCSPNYCRRYRPTARYPATIDTPRSHIGFRCIKRNRASKS